MWLWAQVILKKKWMFIFRFAIGFLQLRSKKKFHKSMKLLQKNIKHNENVIKYARARTNWKSDYWISFWFWLAHLQWASILKRLINLYRNPFSPWSDKQIKTRAHSILVRFASLAPLNHPYVDQYFLIVSAILSNPSCP